MDPISGRVLSLGCTKEIPAGQPGGQSSQALQRLGVAWKYQRHEGEAVQDAGPWPIVWPAGGAKILKLLRGVRPLGVRGGTWVGGCGEVRGFLGNRLEPPLWARPLPFFLPSLPSVLFLLSFLPNSSVSFLFLAPSQIHSL